MTRLYDSLIGVPWFHREAYDVARARMDDPGTLPILYDDWLADAEDRERKIRRDGATPQRVYVDGDEFIAFCRARDCLIDRRAQRRFAEAFVRHSKANVDSYEALGPVFYRPGRPRKR